MTRDVFSICEDDRLAIATDVMQLGRVRHLPVVSAEDELVGILSQRDLFRDALAQSIAARQGTTPGPLHVREVMTPQVVTIGEGASLVEAARLMTERKVGCLVVLEPNRSRIAGILTESDFVRLHT